MIEEYYPMMLAKGLFFQTALTEIPTPGQNARIPSALTLTLRPLSMLSARMACMFYILIRGSRSRSQREFRPVE
jgi:hypothetical protein